MANWIKLSNAEDKTVWREFKKKFQFRPSVHKKNWPGIREPYWSITYDISHVFNNIKRLKLENDLQDKVAKAFQVICEKDELIYAFDWQHPSYQIVPGLIYYDNWKIPAFPDGDYYIFFT
jgi:hypothetical protein